MKLGKLNLLSKLLSLRTNLIVLVALSSLAALTALTVPRIADALSGVSVSWQNNCSPSGILGTGCQGNTASVKVTLTNTSNSTQNLVIRGLTFACNQGIFSNIAGANCGQNLIRAINDLTITLAPHSSYTTTLNRSVPQGINGAFCGSAQVDLRYRSSNSTTWSIPYWGFAFTNQNCASKMTPNIRTQIHNPSHTDITGTTVPIGTIVHDKAIVAGSGPTPTGTVNFLRYSTINCSGTATIQSGVPLSGGAAESAAFKTKVGFLSYRARYNGNSIYNPAAGGCEPLTIAKITPLVTTQVEDANNNPGTTFPINSTIHDRAKVWGAGPIPTGTVTFRHFESPNCTNNLIQTFSNVPLNSFSNPAFAVSGTSTRTIPQTSSYQAIYNGDGNYNPVTGPCEPYTITAPPPPPPGSNQGCTLGYWKNHAGTGPQANAWGPTGYSPSQLVRNVFAVPTVYAAWIANSTLLQALSFQGGPDLNGGAQILLKQAVAALLNAAYPRNVLNYPLTPTQVISQVNSALATLNRSTLVALGSTLDDDNSLGCPLN